MYADAARGLGVELARRGLGLVYGGGHVGLMGIVANAVLGAGGEVVGVMPDHLVAKEIQHKQLTKLHVVATMHERKALMNDLADGFIALPGGFGTYDEFCEVVTWGQLGLHKKPCGILNVAGFFDPLLALFDHATAEGFIRPDHRAMVLVEGDPARLLDRCAEYRAPIVEKWLTRADV
jgi:uncharacterized protein (TIGR00730 family)